LPDKEISFAVAAVVLFSASFFWFFPSGSSTFVYLSQFLFHVTFFVISFGLSRFFITQKVQDTISRSGRLIWGSHGPATIFVLYFCTSEGCFKYLGGTVLILLYWSFGSDCKDLAWVKKWDHVKNFFAINLHHNGSVVAFYFQQPDHAFWNALLFGQVWNIHGKFLVDGYLKDFVKKVFGHDVQKGEIENVYAVGNVLIAAFYSYFMDMRDPYVLTAVVSMFWGRNLANSNWLNVKWMGNLETPGVLFVIICGVCRSWYGVLAGVAAVTVFLWACKKYRVQQEDSKKLPSRFLMNDKIREFLKSYPQPEKDNATLSGAISWFDGHFGKEKRPLFRAICGGDEKETKALLESGENPNQIFPEWYDSTPMQWCAGGGHISCAVVLLHAGVNPFAQGVREAARNFSKTHFIKFLDELAPLVFEAIRDEEFPNVKLQKHEAPGLTWDASKIEAESKNGRLLTQEEALKFVMGSPIVTVNGVALVGQEKEHQWCAIEGKDNTRDWIFIGSSPMFEPGKLHLPSFGKPTWGDDVNDKTHGAIFWNRILLYTVDETKQVRSENERSGGA